MIKMEERKNIGIRRKGKEGKEREWGRDGGEGITRKE